MQKREREKEKKYILLYYKALIFWELFFIQAAVFVRKTHNLKFSVLKNFLFALSLLLLASSRIHGVVEKQFFYIYNFLCLYYFPRVLYRVVLLKKTQKLTVIFFIDTVLLESDC